MQIVATIECINVRMIDFTISRRLRILLLYLKFRCRTVLRLTSELYPNTGQKDDFTLSTYQLIISTAPYFLFVFILAQEHIDLVYNNQV